VKTADQQKKNMIDLQLKCEKLSSMLQNEQANQRDIQHKIYATKQLCGALKEQASRLADNVSRGEDDRDELRLQERQLLDQHDELLTKFRELEMSQRKKHDELKKRCDEQQIQLREQEHAHTTLLSSMQLKVSKHDYKL
jgi:chromosome segregation ATPase